MDKKILWVGVATLALIGLVAVSAMFFQRPASFRGTSYGEPYPPAPPIELKQADGKTFHLNDQRGKIVLLFFGYTSCPDVCPTTLARLSVAIKQIGDLSKNVQVVFVSVDPERDTPEKIQKYAEQFNPSFIGLSGSMSDLETIWQEYGVFREVVVGDSAMNYSVNHTARITLIDADGNMRLTYGYQTPPEDIAHDVKILLGQ